MLCMQAATRMLWTNRAGAGTRMIDGLKDTGGVRLRPQARAGAIRGYCRWFRWDQKPRTGYDKDSAGRTSGQSTVRFAVAFEATAILAVVVQHTEWQRLGVKVRQGPRQELQCTMDRESGF